MTIYDSCYGLTVGELLKKAVSSSPDKEVVYDRTRRITYGELDRLSTQLALGLKHHFSIQKGDRVAVCLPNWHEFLVVYFAVSKLGAILVPMNIRYRREEVEYILNDSGAKVAFIPREFGGVGHLEMFKEMFDKVPTFEDLITVRFEDEHYLSYRQLIEEAYEKPLPPSHLDYEEEVFTILYTSGTTGRPKGAMLTHRNVVHTGTITAEAMRCTPDDVFLVAVPVFHVFGMVPSIITAVAAEARMVFMDVYKAEEALKLIEQEKITVHHGVPTMFILELNHPNFKKYDLTSLRTGIIAAAPCPVEVVRRIRTEMGCNICVAYGLTETSPTLTITSFDDSDELRSETVGRPLPGAEVKIVDDNRNELPYGAIGELACRSFGVMKGYYQKPEQTKEAIDEEGWFYTGDLATMDERGYVRIVGRKKEMIIRGGYNIYPREIEELYYTHPKVMEVAIVGLPDSVLGEVTCAVIRLKPNMEATEEEMKAFVVDKVADYKIPDKILFRDELPMTASGKIQKTKLREILVNELKGELR